MKTLLANLPTVYSDGDGQAEDISLSVVMERWREERQPPPRAWQEWTKARERFEAVVDGDLNVREITKAHVRAFKDSLARRVRRHGNRPLPPASIAKNLAALRAVLAWAVSQRHVDDNVARGITHAGPKRAPDGVAPATV